MKLTDEQIASIMTKESKSKTLLVDKKDKEITIDVYKKDGWKLIKETEVNGRTKLTFIK
jgi:hypothetical protein